MSVEIAIENLKGFPPDRQQEVMDFIEFLQAREQHKLEEIPRTGTMALGKSTSVYIGSTGNRASESGSGWIVGFFCRIRRLGD